MSVILLVFEINDKYSITTINNGLTLLFCWVTNSVYDISLTNLDTELRLANE